MFQLNVTVPQNAVEIYAELQASGNGNEEFWVSMPLLDIQWVTLMERTSTSTLRMNLSTRFRLGSLCRMAPSERFVSQLTVGLLGQPSRKMPPL